MTASAWLTLDHLTQGRVILGVGAGEAENLIPYGFDHSRPVRRMEEALQVIRALWENDGPVDHRGEFFTLDGAICGLSPFRPGRFPPIWLGSHGRGRSTSPDASPTGGRRCTCLLTTTRSAAT